MCTNSSIHTPFYTCSHTQRFDESRGYDASVQVRPIATHRQTVERTNMIGRRINFNFKLASISCVKTSLISLIFSYLLPSMNSEHRSSRIAPLFSFRFTPFRTLLPSRLQTRAVRSTTHPSIHWSISNRLISIHSATTGYLSISHASSSSSFRLYPASNTHK